MLSFTKAHARAALAQAHGLSQLAKGKARTLSVMRRHCCIQSDPINVAGRNHDITLQSRVSDYSPEYLDRLLYRDRRLFEYTCKMLSILPIETYPVFHSRRQFHAEQNRPFMAEHAKEVKAILKAAEQGPVASRDLESAKKDHWWGMTKVARIALERLWTDGTLVIHHRKGGEKFYALAENVIPSRYLEAEPPSEEDALMAKTLFIARASRLVSPTRASEQWYFAGKKSSVVSENLKSLAKAGELFELSVEGCKGPLYAPAEDEYIWTDPPEPRFMRFMAPLDPLLWNRSLFAELYGREYKWEVYKRPHERIHGYYCLPVIFNGDYVGLIEPFFRKKDKVLELRSFHILEKNIDRKALKKVLCQELARFAGNLRAESVKATEVCPTMARSAAKHFSGQTL